MHFNAFTRSKVATCWTRTQRKIGNKWVRRTVFRKIVRPRYAYHENVKSQFLKGELPASQKNHSNNAKFTTGSQEATDISELTNYSLGLSTQFHAARGGEQNNQVYYQLKSWKMQSGKSE